MARAQEVKITKDEPGRPTCMRGSARGLGAQLAGRVADDGSSERSRRTSAEPSDARRRPRLRRRRPRRKADQMARIIPNENTWIGFTPAAITDIEAHRRADRGAVDLTGYCISLNASARGNTVPTPAFDCLFETSTAGTSAATFDADFYRDDDGTTEPGRRCRAALVAPSSSPGSVGTGTGQPADRGRRRRGLDGDDHLADDGEHELQHGAHLHRVLLGERRAG